MTLKEAIERYKNNAEYDYTHGNLQKYLEFEQLVKWLKELEQLREQTKWIPASERSPKSAGVYRVLRFYQSDIIIVNACYFDGSNTWYNDNRINHERAYVNNIIAWQENPEVDDLDIVTVLEKHDTEVTNEVFNLTISEENLSYFKKKFFNKDEVLAMLVELQQKIDDIAKKEELIDKKWANGLYYSKKIIQQKIDSVKED